MSMQEPSSLILSALTTQPLHGYGLVSEVQKLSAGRVRLSIGIDRGNPGRGRHRDQGPDRTGRRRRDVAGLGHHRCAADTDSVGEYLRSLKVSR